MIERRTLPWSIPFHLSIDHGTEVDSQDVHRIQLSLDLTASEIETVQAFVPCTPSGSLLTADIGGVSDPFTGKHGARTQGEAAFSIETQCLRSRGRMI